MELTVVLSIGFAHLTQPKGDLSMKRYRRFFQTILLFLTMNVVSWGAFLHNRMGALTIPDSMGDLLYCLFRISPYLICGCAFLVMEIIPCIEEGLSFRLQLLSGGYELVLTSTYVVLPQLFMWIFLAVNLGVTSLFWWNLGVSYCILLLHYLNGFWRTALYSKQLGLGRRVAMFFLWWFFPINLFLMVRWCRIVRRELITARDKYLLEQTRVQNAICQTQYPVVMVHGICFRDWQFFNYWGRIPKALKQNGASIFYGRQSSALSIADSAEELKSEILRILEETGAPKVNIIAHSKGGLDSRYAITRLGMAPYVASLTTINTPHRGCKYADVLLNRLPKGFISFLTRRYNALYYMLGDERPDLLAGLKDLTASACEKFNQEIPNSPDVSYQSIASGMKKTFTAFSPLNFSYLVVKHYDGENDGLVAIDSAIWGTYLGSLSEGKNPGLSHADVIDLTHKDIKGFDVSEFYVGLLAKLKEQGF